NGQLKSFCIDIAQSSSQNAVVYDVRAVWEAPVPLYGPMGPQKEEYLRELWGRYFPTAAADAADAEVFSACAWEIIYEDADPNVWDVTAGTGFRCELLSDSVKANAWLASLDGTGRKANLAALTHDDYQDFLVETISPIPEPGTLLLIVAGAPLLMRRRRR
ncbi:MAG TPA: PEP-CTERM sorting domain-containing protein, partial [Phycisphaerae bacterium]|nr:PEP-CTERM sorting domain-containing protein [Phycisphaerae bacterium]